MRRRGALPDYAARTPTGVSRDGEAAALRCSEQAAVDLLNALDALGYRFTTVTPESHRRVIARPSMRQARTLRCVFGWSLPFAEGLLPPDIFEILKRARVLRATGAGWKATVRVSTVRDCLFLHSAFPTVAEDSVFLGPDTIRFADFILAELDGAPPVRRLVDIGAGAGVGGIIAARAMPGAQAELVDINARALSHARVNAAHAGVVVQTYESDGVSAVPPGFDLAIANPPFIIDEDGPTYRAGGGMHGAELSRDWAVAAAEKLSVGGRVLLYTGSAIVDGEDALRTNLDAALPALGCTLSYRELDPDIFGEELDGPAYAEVDRIAAIGAVISKTASPGTA